MDRAIVVIALWAASTAWSAPADAFLERIKAVGKEGVGNQEAGAAWKNLINLDGETLLPTLKAMDDASPTASNWLRTAAIAIFEKQSKDGKTITPGMLEKYVLDRQNGPTGRRVAYELLVQLDAKTPDRLLPGMIDDPSVELRRDAIGAAMEKIEPLVKSKPEEAKAQYEKLFTASREENQAVKISKSLKELGGKPDLSTHFGVVTEWKLVGPFDGPKGSGYAKAFDPEKSVDFAATYKGKNDADIKWKTFKTEDPLGVVDLNKAIGKNMDAVAYAYTQIETDREQTVELRFGTPNALKIYLNGKEIYAREEYHHGERFDQYHATAKLTPGKHFLLVKICQDNQKESWTQNWQFRLRLSDATGGALPLKVSLSGL
jgi:hypothetical protein